MTVSARDPSSVADLTTISDFRSIGACCVRQVVADEMVRALSATADRVLNAPPSLFSTAGTPLPLAYLWVREPTVRAVLQRTAIAELAARLMGARRVRLFYDEFLVKHPDTDAVVRWHQDLSYWPVRGSQLCTVWLALDATDQRNGRVEYLAGSHRDCPLFRPPDSPGSDYFADVPLAPLPDFDMHTPSTTVSWDLAPGDCVVHDARVVHGSGRNLTDQNRRAYVTRWAGDDVVYAPRPKTIEFPLDVNLTDGAELHHQLFPCLWTA